ncbi:MAG: hypothetical protein AB7O26_01805 [Planctomycetaceae bacterium]
MNIELLAVGLEEVIGLIVVVLTILGSLINFLSGKNQPQQPRPQQRRPQQPMRGDKISNEIEVFLQEVTGRKPPQRPAERPVPRPASPPEQPAPRRVVAPRPAATAPPAPERKVLQPVAASPATLLGDRPAPGSQDLGSSVRTHLNEYMDPTRLEKQVAADMRDTVAAAVQAHLGQFAGASLTGHRSEKKHVQQTHPIVALLRNPDGVRQAILIKEVLERRSSTGRLRRK